jgi:hypothetical protein
VIDSIQSDPLYGLKRVALEFDQGPVPNNVQTFVDDWIERTRAAREEFNTTAPEFIPSNALLAYHSVLAIRDQDLATGNRFCEWGSGLGAAAAVASLAGFDACGIEIVGELVEASRELLATHDIPAAIFQGSFKPAGSYEDEMQDSPEFDGEFEFHPAHFDVIFAYPWPSEVDVVMRIFKRYAPPGALLLTYHGREGIRAHRQSQTGSTVC